MRPYLPAHVPPVRLMNSTRLRDLMRAGILYLTAQDAIALALEDNIDIEVARYNPSLSAWQLERAQAGGLLPGVPSGAAQAGSVATGQGVAGSQAAAGVTSTGASGATSTASNATISQIGPITQNLDPSIQEVSTFSHRTTPQFDVIQSIIPVLVSDSRAHTATYQQGFLAGGSVTVTYSDHYLNENAPTDVLNPSVAPNLSIAFQQNLLRGFGVAVNARTITVAKMNLNITDLNFRSQVIGTVAQVLNAYYALVADYEDIKAKQSALEAGPGFICKQSASGRAGGPDSAGRDHGGSASRLRFARPAGFANQPRGSSNSSSRTSSAAPAWRTPNWPARALCLSIAS